MQAPKIPSSWNECSWEQIQEIYRLTGEYSDRRSVRKTDTIPMVSEVNTTNAVMKWQGFTEHQKVFDSNAIFIFSIFNSMTKEAKAIEEANQKMKAKRK